MTKSRKGLWTKIAIIVCALALLTTCMLSNTFAKYTSKVTGDASATVAVWSFKANEKTDTFTIDLSNAADPYVDVFGNNINDNFKENNVVPGTYGAFNLVVDARGSEVNIDVSIVFANLNKPEHLKIFTSPTKVTDFEGDTTGMTEFDPVNDSQDVTLIMNNGVIDTTTTIFFYWTWDFEPTFTYTGTPAELATFDNDAFMTAVQTAYELANTWTPKVVYDAGVVTDQAKLDAYIAATIDDAQAAYNKIDTDYAEVLDVIIPTAEEITADGTLVAATKKAIEDTYLVNMEDKAKTDWIAKWLTDNGVIDDSAKLTAYKAGAKALNAYQPLFKFDINVTGTQRTATNP